MMLVRCGGTVVDVRNKSVVRGAVVAIFIIILFMLLRRNQAPAHSESDEERARERLSSLYGERGASQVRNASPPRMAMDAAKSKYDTILKMQKTILENQNRPDDSHYNINVTLSDRISMDRHILDTRPEVCSSGITYDRSRLPRASVIIPFYNEALSMLLRTVHSLLNNSPDELLSEIILVDDASNRDYLGKSLAKYVQMLPKTVLIRNTQRDGLIVSRLRGSRMARGPVVIFLDAHTEANVGWLEPLLQEILDHPNTIAQPFVDGIDTGTIEYSAPANLFMGSFSWDLRYTWLKVPDHVAARSVETGHPYFSPTLVGCAIAMDKEYFEKIGEFDEGLKVWGGENIELGFRAWQCGGRVTTVICSRVGHVFKNFAYKFDGDREIIVAKNLMRVAETWMDSYRKYYYASARTYEFKRTELTSSELATLKERISLREKLQCKNFEWYMMNVIPQLEPPPTDSVYYGEIQNTRTQACWEVLEDYQIGMNYLCYEHKIMPQNFFRLTTLGLLKYKDKCVHFSPPEPVLRLVECPAAENIETFGVWEVANMGHVWGKLKVRRKNHDGNWDSYCIMQVTNVFGAHQQEQMPEIAKCSDENEFQAWAFTWKFSWDQVPTHVQESRNIV